MLSSAVGGWDVLGVHLLGECNCFTPRPHAGHAEDRPDRKRRQRQDIVCRQSAVQECQRPGRKRRRDPRWVSAASSGPNHLTRERKNLGHEQKSPIDGAAKLMTNRTFPYRRVKNHSHEVTDLIVRQNSASLEVFFLSRNRSLPLIDPPKSDCSRSANAGIRSCLSCWFHRAFRGAAAGRRHARGTRRSRRCWWHGRRYARYSWP